MQTRKKKETGGETSLLSGPFFTLTLFLCTIIMLITSGPRDVSPASLFPSTAYFLVHTQSVIRKSSAQADPRENSDTRKTRAGQASKQSFMINTLKPNKPKKNVFLLGLSHGFNQTSLIVGRKKLVQFLPLMKLQGHKKLIFHL